MMYYVCTGEIPAHLLKEPVKVNRAFNMVLLFTAIVHLSFFVRLIIFKLMKKRGFVSNTSNVGLFLKEKFRKDAIFR